MKIVAHRGYSALYPENTMAAFRRAWEVGADGVELDVRVTKDGRYVVFHDVDGQRLAGMSRSISQCTWDDISGWDVGLWKGSEFQGMRIPLLSEVLSEVPDQSIVLIELKFEYVDRLDQLVHLLAPYPQLVLMLITFDVELAAACAGVTQNVPVYLNVAVKSAEEIEPLKKVAVKNKCTGLSMQWAEWIDYKLVESLNNAGLNTAVWTVNNADDALCARDVGIDVLMTDDPEKMISAVSHG